MGIRIPQLPEVSGLSPSALLVVSQGGATFNVPVSVITQGLQVKAAVATSSTENVALSGEQTLDGVLTSATRVLLRHQTDPAENGIWMTAAGAWARATDADTWGELVNAFVFVEAGTDYGKTGWASTIPADGVLGADPITWEQLSAAGNFTAGDGLDLTGTVFSLEESAAFSVLANTTGAEAVPTPLVLGDNTFVGRTGGTMGAKSMVAAFFAFAALTLGSANELPKVNAAGTAIEYGLITAENIDPSAEIALSQLEAIAALSVVANATNGTAVPTAVAAASDHQVFRRSGTALAFGAVNLASSNAVTGLLPFANIADLSALSVFGRSVNSSGVGASITGTDGQVLRVSGTTLGFGTIASAGLADDSVTFAKFQNIATDRLLGRDTAGTGDVEEISLNATLEFTGSSSIQRAALTGDVTAVAGSNTTAIAAGVIIDADVNANAAIALSKLETIAALSVVTNATNGSAVPTALAAGSSGHVLRRSGSALEWNTLTNANISSGAAIDLSKLATQAALTVVANATNGTAVPTAVAAGSDHQVFRRSGTALAFGAVNLASSAAVTGLLPFANIADGSALSVLGRSANSSGVMASIAGTDGQVLRVSGTTLGFGTIATAGIADDAVTLAKLVNPTGDGVFLYGSSSAWVETTTLKVVGGTALSFGSDPATGAQLNYSTTAVAEGRRTNATDAVLWAWTSDDLEIGSVTIDDLILNTGSARSIFARIDNSTRMTITSSAVTVGANNASLTSLALSVGTGGAVTILVAGGTEFTANATELNLSSNNLLTTGEVRFDGTAATGGKLNFVHNQTAAVGRTNGGSNATLWAWGVGSNDRLTIGSTGVTQILTNIATGGNYTLQINSGTEFGFDASTFNVNQNSIADCSLIQLGGSNFATAGTTRYANAAVETWRNVTNDGNIQALQVTSGNIIFLGGSSGNSGIVIGASSATAIALQINGGTELQLTSTQLSLTDNILTWSSTFDTPIVQQTIDTNATSATVRFLTIAGQDKSGTTDVTCGTLFLRGGNATGGSGTRNGGDLRLRPGTGATSDGDFIIDYNGSSSVLRVLGGSGLEVLTTASAALITCSRDDQEIGFLGADPQARVTITENQAGGWTTNGLGSIVSQLINALDENGFGFLTDAVTRPA